VNTCTKCGSFNMVTSNDNYALTIWNFQNDQVTVNPGQFLPVKGSFCSSCGHLELKVDAESLKRFQK